MVHSGARLHGSWGVVGGGIGLVAIAPILPTLNRVGAFLLIAGFLVVAAIVAQFGAPGDSWAAARCRFPVAAAPLRQIQRHETLPCWIPGVQRLLGPLPPSIQGGGPLWDALARYS